MHSAQTPAAPAKSAASPIPYLIIGTFVLFAAYIGLMVARAMQTDVELVSADYYQQELDYQQRIAAKARTAALAVPIQLVATADRLLLVKLPRALAGQPIQGNVRFFRPSDARLDFTVPLQPSPDLTQLLNTSRLQPGHWRVQLDFTANGQAYFVEETLSL
ncbi:MAG: FixH family protein [Hymenobacteraceae bacterium]|nr:FixH family protein [Hymenobacteraceae bacterium]